MYDYDQSLGNFKKRMNGALEDLKRGQEKAKELGFDLELKKSSTEEEHQKLLDQGIKMAHKGGNWAFAFIDYLLRTEFNLSPSKAKKAIFIDFFKDIPSLGLLANDPFLGWEKSFEKNFFMTVEKFYERFENEFLKMTDDEKKAILIDPEIFKD